jgi:uncharacterized protein Yka (UPF0111/DUF47 family)
MQPAPHADDFPTAQDRVSRVFRYMRASGKVRFVDQEEIEVHRQAGRPLSGEEISIEQAHTLALLDISFQLGTIADEIQDVTRAIDHAAVSLDNPGAA